ncbi:hypothetical protein ACOME3_004206 [Neoechinorhynchus agilis]
MANSSEDSLETSGDIQPAVLNNSKFIAEEHDIDQRSSEFQAALVSNFRREEKTISPNPIIAATLGAAEDHPTKSTQHPDFRSPVTIPSGPISAIKTLVMAEAHLSTENVFEFVFDMPATPMVCLEFTISLQEFDKTTNDDPFPFRPKVVPSARNNLSEVPNSFEESLIGLTLSEMLNTSIEELKVQYCS